MEKVFGKIIPVVLAGGVGSRLWPVSREGHPKQFIKLSNNLSLIQITYLRALSIEGVDEIITVTNRELYFYTKDQYEEVQENAIKNTFILEPFGKNSAPAIALAAETVKKEHGDDALILVLPADHLIEDNQAFLDAVKEAVSLAKKGQLVTFGITPFNPNTGYGYIEAVGNKVCQFVEKPDLEKAKAYLKAGNYLWNSGIFCMRVGTLLDEIIKYYPSLVEKVYNCINNANINELKDNKQIEIHAVDFNEVENISIDYAVLEKSNLVAVVPCDIAWTDIGDWYALGQLNEVDNENNYVKGNVITEQTKNCIVYAEHRTVALLGVDDLIVVDTGDAVLVLDKRKSQDVKKVYERLKDRDDFAYKKHPTEYRPWGSYTVLEESPDYKIKRLYVKPGARLSLQMHKYRNEHWVVVSGRAKVFNDGKGLVLNVNESTYIPAGHKHRLENMIDEPLIMIEVQVGSYLGEDDIVRYSDEYGRERQEDLVELAKDACE